MKRRVRVLMQTIWLVFCLQAGTVRAQLQTLWSGKRLLAEQRANLFARWQGESPFYGVLIEVPPDWSVHRAWALRFGHSPMALQIDTLVAGRFALQPARPITDPLVLCIEVTPGNPGVVFWQLAPLEPANAAATPTPSYTDRTQRLPLLVQPADLKNPQNHVLAVRHSTWTLPIADTLRRWLDLQHPFTLALWLKSTARDAVVLSTWSGEELQSYPLELVLDEAGFLRVYRGRPGLHQALITPHPIADGSWHHVTLTYDPVSGWSRLYLDGQRVDSLFSPEHTPIDPPEALVLGGRPASSITSVGFEGYVDVLVLDRRVWSPAQIRRRFRQADPPTDGFRFDFESPLPHLPQGLQRRRADLFFFEPLQHLRVLRADNGYVLLNWTCTDRQTRAFLVERSTNGRDFTAIARLPARCEGLPYTFQDPSPPEVPVLYYRIQQVLEGNVLYPSTVFKLGLAPIQTGRALLLGNFPNPFQGRTTIQYELHTSMPIRLSIWDLSGHEVRVLIDAVQAAGQYTLTFEAEDLPSGTYFLRLKTPEGVQTHKMILIR